MAVGWSEALRAAAYLLEHPDQWVEFKQRFGLEVARAAVKLAEKHLPPEMAAQVKRDLGMADD